ncbi:MAG: hypothetical protein Ta2B_25350 [Termitinemataceae bacterium]|nr:MAG: hypothetical protein Ta2B_25350 [Termitinemataceae bacterium]
MNTMNLANSAKNWGGNRNSVENILNHSKTFLLVAAVIAIGILFTACPPPDESISTSKPGPNTNPSTQLFKLVVTYTGTTTPANLITFGAEQGYYNLDTPTDAAQTSIKVDAEAAQADARIRIWWVNGYEGGGMDEDNGSNKAFVDNIPIPRTQDNVVVYVLVSNPDESTFEYQIEIEPPLADTTLESLVVKLDNAGNNLITNFNPNISSYIVFIPNDASNVGKPVNVTATVAQPQEGEEEAAVLIEPNPAVVPSMGSEAALIRVTVTKNDVSSVYKINIVPPQNDEVGDARLTALQFDYLGSGVGDPGTPIITGFNPDTTSYSFNVPDDAKKIKLSNIQTASSAASNITITYGSNTPYLNSAPSGITFPLGSAKEITLPARPVGGSATPLTFTIAVKAQNNSTRTYEVSFNNPARLQVWSGTVEFSGGNADGRVFHHVEAVIPEQPNNVLSDGMLPSDYWSLPIDARLTPSEFIVVMTKTVSGSSVTYKKSFTATPLKYTGNDFVVVVAETARMIYNADDLAAIGDAANKGENWYLNNDIDLADYTGGGDWVGPSGYYGVFDGNGKTIRNLELKNMDSRGLFNSLEAGAVLKNFTLIAETPNPLAITDYRQFGGVIGSLTAGTGNITIQNINFTGEFKFSGSSGGLSCGGLIGTISVGNQSNVLIEKCVSNLTVTANLTNTSTTTPQIFTIFGGLVGKFDSASDGSAVIKNSYATGNINVTAKAADQTLYAGGLAGATLDPNSKVDIQNSFSNVDISVNRDAASSNKVYVGGICAFFDSTVADKKITDSIALNSTLSAASTTAANAQIGRVLGCAATGKIALSSNLANSAMTTTTGGTVLSGNPAGTNVTLSDKATILAKLGSAFEWNDTAHPTLGHL